MAKRIYTESWINVNPSERFPQSILMPEEKDFQEQAEQRAKARAARTRKSVGFTHADKDALQASNFWRRPW